MGMFAKSRNQFNFRRNDVLRWNSELLRSEEACILWVHCSSRHCFLFVDVDISFQSETLEKSQGVVLKLTLCSTCGWVYMPLTQSLLTVWHPINLWPWNRNGLVPSHSRTSTGAPKTPLAPFNPALWKWLSCYSGSLNRRRPEMCMSAADAQRDLTAEWS